jgi:predicted metalloprotease
MLGEDDVPQIRSVNRPSNKGKCVDTSSLRLRLSRLISEHIYQVTYLMSLAIVVLLTSCGGPQEPTIGDVSGPSTSSGSSQSSDAHFQEIMNIAVGSPPPQNSDIDNFWQQAYSAVSGMTQFPFEETQYVSPSAFHPYLPSDPPSTSCPQEFQLWANNSFYCSTDESISWDESWLRGGGTTRFAGFTRDHDMVPLTIIAHEWGHHIENLANPNAFRNGSGPPYSIQKELQADCYAGLYIRYAQDYSRGITLELGDVDEAADALFRIGDQSYDQARWFDPLVHGQPIQRKVAFGSGFLTYDPSYCTSYWNFQPLDDLSVGPYLLTPLSETTYTPPQNGVTQLSNARLPSYSAYTTWRSDLASDQAAVDQIDAVAQDWFSGSQMSFLGGVDAFPVLSKGTSATQRYERTYTDDSGVRHTEDGAIYLHIREEGGGLIFSVSSTEAAPLDETGWKDLIDYFNASLYGLQVD